MKQQVTKEQESYVTINPGSFYHNAAASKGWCSADTWLVVGFVAWNKWYNQVRFANKKDVVPVPYPAATADSYQIALKIANQLNEGIA